MALLTKRTKGPDPQRSLIASAVLVKQSQLRQVPEQQDWQTSAWDYFDKVGELRFASQWFSNALSRCSLRVLRVGSDGKVDADAEALTDEDADAQAAAPLEELFGGPAGHGEALARLGIHLTVPGETYVVGLDMPDTGERRWIVASSEEFSKHGRQIRVRLPDSDTQITVDTTSSTVIRIWRPHARRAWEADSPVRAVLPVLKELCDLGSHITASVESRLAGAGIWEISQNAQFPKATSQGEKPLHEDPRMAALIDAMITPLGDRNSAAAVVPIIMSVPDEVLGKSRHITFSTPLDAAIQTLREAATKRLAMGLDLPLEVVLGTVGQANHWSAWLLDETSVKLHVEPLLTLICSALTERYLRPALKAMDVANPEQYAIWYDVTELTQRANKSPEAQALHDLLLVGGKTVRRESGFTEDDAPDATELKRLLVTQLALKGIDPTIVQPYLDFLGVDIDLPIPVQGNAPPVGQDGAPAVPSEREQDPVTPPGDTGRPEIPAEPQQAPDGGPPLAASLAHWPMATVEMGVVQALSMVGKRLLNWDGRKWRGRIDCEAWEIHTRIPPADFDPAKLLEGAYACLDQVLGDQPLLRDKVDIYVRTLLAAQRRYSRTELFDILCDAGCLGAETSAVA